MTAVWFLLVVAAVSVLGAWLGDTYTFLGDVHLPQALSGDARTAAAFGTAALAVLVAIVAATVGGKLGARYHRRADQLWCRPDAGASRRPATWATTNAASSRTAAHAPRPPTGCRGGHDHGR
jgi:hypothetical protein